VGHNLILGFAGKGVMGANSVGLYDLMKNLMLPQIDSIHFIKVL
jgi:hypothetical protein